MEKLNFVLGNLNETPFSTKLRITTVDFLTVAVNVPVHSIILRIIQYETSCWLEEFTIIIHVLLYEIRRGKTELFE